MFFPQEHDCLEIQDFLFFYFIFLASKQAKTYTKPWSNSDTLTQSATTIRKKEKKNKKNNWPLHQPNAYQYCSTKKKI